GCTGIEHGTLSDAATLQYVASHGVYFDGTAGLVSQNYIANRAKYLGIGNYTEQGFAFMEKNLPVQLSMYKMALATKGLKAVYGTDAVAGAHGRNAEGLIYHVQQAGEDTSSAIVSATSLAAESLRMSDKIGSIAAGMNADLIGVEGDPLKD